MSEKTVNLFQDKLSYCKLPSIARRMILLVFCIYFTTSISCVPSVEESSPAPFSQHKNPEVIEQESGESLSIVSTPASVSDDPSDPSNIDIPPTKEQQIPEIQWDNSSNDILVLATFCCGYTSQTARLNYIPDALIWGNGRIIWTQYDEGNSRRVLEGILNVNQIEDLLDRVYIDGFYTWDSYYSNPMISDFADKCLLVQTKSQKKSVCEYYEGAPEAFHELYDFIANGVETTGSNYIPNRGYLIAHPHDSVTSSATNDITAWPDNSEFAIEEALNGIWVEGELLLSIWNIVNLDPFGALVQDNGNIFSLSIQIPELSQTELPNQ